MLGTTQASLLTVLTHGPLALPCLCQIGMKNTVWHKNTISSATFANQEAAALEASAHSLLLTHAISMLLIAIAATAASMLLSALNHGT